METLDQQESEIMDDELVTSEDEQEQQEEEKEKFTNSVTFTQPFSQNLHTILICAHGTAQSLAKIIFFGHMKEVGKGETVYHDKPIDTLKIYFIEGANILLLMPEPTLKSAFTNNLTDILFGQLKGVTFQRIVVLDEIYQTNYSTTDTGSISSVSDHPLKYYKSSFANSDGILNGFLKKYQPAGVLNIIGGFNAAVMIYAEMNGIPAAVINSIVDSHYVSAETLQNFTPVVREVLEMGAVNMDKIAAMPNFKATLKEANTRDNNIFN